MEEAEINALLSLAGHIQCFDTYNARTALEVALHCCTGVRSKGNVSSSRGASHLAGSCWTIRLLSAGGPHSSAAPVQKKTESHRSAQKCFAEVCVQLTAQGETRNGLYCTSPKGDSMLFWGRTVIQPWPISFYFKREIKSNENFYFHVMP